jgi:hypothetical protein
MSTYITPQLVEYGTLTDLVLTGTQASLDYDPGLVDHVSRVTES